MFKSLFSKKSKAEFKAHCALSKEPLQKESCYAVTTAEIISSKRFWDNKMTEPDTMSYTINHFKNGDQTATQIRKMIFEKYASEDKLWVISDAQLHMFDVDVDSAKQLGDTWWENKGEIKPGDSAGLQKLGQDIYEEFKAYAIMYAGKKQAASLI